MNKLKQRTQWCVWRRAEVRGKIKKIPCYAKGAAKTNDQSTWMTYADAQELLTSKEGFDGLGLFFTPALCGIDIDGDHGQGSGDHNPLEKVILDAFAGTYAERSPSGTGVHILFYMNTAKLPKNYKSVYMMKNDAQGLEMYIGGQTNRFFTYTGKQISQGDVIADMTESAFRFLDEYMRRTEPVTAATPEITQATANAGSTTTHTPVMTTAATADPASTDDFDEWENGNAAIIVQYDDGQPAAAFSFDPETVQRRLNAARNAKNGDAFIALYDHGDLSAYDGDDSRADLALCYKLAFYLSGDAMAIDEAFRKSALYRPKWDEKRGASTYGEMTIQRAISSQKQAYKGEGANIVFKYRPDDEFDLSDSGNALKFASLYGDKIRWCPALGWLVWDGQVWRQDDEKALASAMDYTAHMLEEAQKNYLMAVQLAMSMGQLKPDDDAAKYFKHACKTRSRKETTALLEMAKAVLTIKAEKLDENPHVFNTAAGLVDLHTGVCVPHDPKAYCTKIAPFKPSDEGRELWDDFIKLVTCNDDELAHYLQIVCGMAIIGKVGFEGIFITVGGGRNGKSTFYDAVSKVLGNYAGTIDVDALTKDAENHKATLATLRGKRLVTCSELDAGQRLSVKTIKRVASTGTLQIERKYHDAEEIVPSHHIFMHTNYLPRVAADDVGTWRRLIVIPFNAQMPTGRAEIKDFAQVLADKAGGYILQWLIAGAVEYVQGGNYLPKPTCVIEATTAYQAKEDMVQQFIDECCENAPDAKITISELYAAYKQFTTSNNVFCLKSNLFRDNLASRGYTITNQGNRPTLKGLALSKTEIHF